jgi:DNA-binding PadR family transcriptional regulator
VIFNGVLAVAVLAATPRPLERRSVSPAALAPPFPCMHLTKEQFRYIVDPSRYSDNLRKQLKDTYMTGAYAQEWPGRGPWAQQGRGERGYGAGSERYGEERGRHGKGRHGDERGPRAEGRHGDERGRHGEGRCGDGHRGGKGRHGRPSDLEALAGWVLARAGGKGGRGHERPTPEEIEELIALRRMRGFGGPGFGGPRGGRGRGRGRARRGDVRLAVLRLLADEPRNGYQLMQTIEERSGGNWRPSPGSMYPTLSQLEDEGLIRSVDADGSRLFQITDAGREHLETRAGEPDPWTPSDEHSENAMAELGPLVIGIGKAVWQVASVGSEQQRTRALDLLDETRRGLYRILAEAPGDVDETADDTEAFYEDAGSPDGPAADSGADALTGEDAPSEG